MICHRCHRSLKNDPVEIDGKKFGPVCGRKVKHDNLLKMYPTLKEFW